MQSLYNIYHLFQSLIANIFYRFPARNLKIIGVTGTDGKTTTTSMIYHILRENGYKTGMISTIFAKIDDEEIDIGLHVTTPEPWDLPRILRKMVNAGIEYVVLESTSSGLDQNRLFLINYDASVITNIGHDHIDYHKTWENYANAKFKIVEKTHENGIVVLNKDHKSSNWLENKISNFKNKKIEWFSSQDLKERNASISGLKFKYKNVEFNIPILGEYNFSNAIAAIKICNRYLSLEQISNALKTFKTPKGRMQIMQQKPFSVIIDFAHTPSSLEVALKSINDIRPSNNTKVICVFGCAGQRDKERRKMGGVSAELADVTIVTIEDPRDEKLTDINSEIIQHAEQSRGKLIKRFQNHSEYESYKQKQISSKEVYAFDYAEIQNRKDAIKFAFSIAQKEDIVYITGKGHEESLAIMNSENKIEEMSYTDQEAVKFAISTQK